MDSQSFTVLAIDPDPGVLTDIVRVLTHKSFHIATRISPHDSLEYISRARPDIVLLGFSYWEEGWTSEILVASPETIVVPVLGPKSAQWLLETIGAGLSADAA